YILRLLYARGVPLEALGVPRRDGAGAGGEAGGTPVETDPCRVWQRFADHYYLFRGPPTGAWLDYELREVFGLRPRPAGPTGPGARRAPRGLRRVPGRAQGSPDLLQEHGSHGHRSRRARALHDLAFSERGRRVVPAGEAGRRDAGGRTALHGPPPDGNGPAVS